MSTQGRLLQVLKSRHLLQTSPFINGKWLRASKPRKQFPVVYPYTGEVLAEVEEVDKEDVENAIKSASEAFQDWKRSSCRMRSSLLRQFFDKVTSYQEDLAKLCTLESGKPIIESRGEVRYGASYLDWFSEEGKRVYGDVIPIAEPNIRRFVLKQPVGVAGLITPWNFPIAMITRKLGAALSVGCTVVLKPSEETPLCGLALAAIAEEVGFPPGVINVLPCSRESVRMVGDMMCEHPLVQKISFTGSTAVGKLLMAKCAGSVKRTSMELGGSAPFIVFDNADVDVAVKAAMVAKFRNKGQTCIAADRFLVQKGIHDSFVNKLKSAVANLVSGDPMQDSTTIGTLINARGAEKVSSHVHDAIDKGAKLVIGSKQGCGLVFSPTILTNCNENMKILREETFGPVTPIICFEDEDEGIRLANNTRAGLAAYVCSTNYGQQWRVAEQLEYGMIGVNEGLISADVAPFGGMKESGIGREGSAYGVDEYLDIKYLCLGGI